MRSWPASFAFALAIVSGGFAEIIEYDFDHYKVINIKSPIVLHCNISTPTSPMLWFKEGVPVKDVPSLKGRYHEKEEEHKLIIDSAIESDSGTYTCSVENSLSANITLITKPTARLPPNTSVVEGEKLRIQCTVQGYPKPTVEWIYKNETWTESSGRVTLMTENDVVNAIFILENATMEDRGEYTCRSTNIANENGERASDSTFVRVKDKLAALWPFLGICAEVFVLCAIILIYEKRRNKPEMDESDTDQSPDQKHTPDHGKDRDVRHRK